MVSKGRHVPSGPWTCRAPRVSKTGLSVPWRRSPGNPADEYTHTEMHRHAQQMCTGHSLLLRPGDGWGVCPRGPWTPSSVEEGVTVDLAPHAPPGLYLSKIRDKTHGPLVQALQLGCGNALPVAVCGAGALMVTRAALSRPVGFRSHPTSESRAEPRSSWRPSVPACEMGTTWKSLKGGWALGTLCRADPPGRQAHRPQAGCTTQGLPGQGRGVCV